MAVLFLLLPYPKDFEHYLSYINTDISKYTHIATFIQTVGKSNISIPTVSTPVIQGKRNANILKTRIHK